MMQLDGPRIPSQMAFSFSLPRVLQQVQSQSQIPHRGFSRLC